MVATARIAAAAKTFFVFGHIRYLTHNQISLYFLMEQWVDTCPQKWERGQQVLRAVRRPATAST